jgi:type VI secretion system secreted protein Hcp
MFRGWFRRPAPFARRPARPHVRPRLEWLEDRTLPQVSAVRLDATPNPSAFGQPVTFTATVSSADEFIPPGTVTFADGNVPLATFPVASDELASEQIVFPTPTALTVGTHAITATYNPSNEGGSAVTSNTVSEVVNPPPSPPASTPSTPTTPTPTPAAPQARAVISLTLTKPKGGTLQAGGTQNGSTAVAFEVTSYHWGISNPVVLGSATGGAGAGKVTFHTFDLELALNSGAALLYKSLVSGEHFTSASITVARPGAGKPFLRWQLKTVFLSRLQLAGGAEAPRLEAELEFGAIVGAFQTQRPDGSLGAVKQVGWNQVLNKVENSPTLLGPGLAARAAGVHAGRVPRRGLHKAGHRPALLRIIREATATGVASQPGPRVGLVLEGMPGEFPKSELALDGFSFEVGNTVTLGSATTGAGAGKASLKGLVVELPPSEASLLLFKKAASGAHFKRGVLTVRLPSGILSLVLDTVFVSSFSESADVGDAEAVRDRVTLTAGSVKFLFTPQSAQGTLGAPVSVSWNRVKNLVT